MKHHKIALELASKQVGQAQGRLPILYDMAMARLMKTESKSITNDPPFKVNIAALSAEPAEFVRATDIETGYYVKLVKSKTENSPRMEIGRIISIEESVQGQLN